MADMRRLSRATVPSVGADVAVPAYDTSMVRPGIVHLGIGAFHRAHQAVYVDDCIADGGLDWGIVGVSLRSTDTRDALAPQDGLYTVAIREGAGTIFRVVGSVVDLLVAPEDPRAVLARMADASTRIVTLTVTEKAYLRSPSGGLDLENEAIKWDLANPDMPRSVYGFIFKALEIRRDAGVAPFTVLCCDNLPSNGETVRRLMLEFADRRGIEPMRFHIGEEVCFPSTMVDRIVPATTERDRTVVSTALGLEDAWPIMTEPFSQWVVEDRFTLGRPSWERHGVTMVQDVAPYEEMKLRLLNGAHSAIAYLGLALGHETVAASFGDPLIRGFVGRLWSEAIPTLHADEGLDAVDYTRRLTERFDNRSLKHRTAQIATDGSQKLPQRIVAPALANLAAGRKADHLAFVVAAWISACMQRGKKLPPDHFTDPLDAELSRIFDGVSDPSVIVEQVFTTAGFGQSGREFERLVSDLLAVIIRAGTRNALSEI